MNGRIVAQGKQFDVRDVEVVVATVDLDEIRSYRSCFQSMSVQSAKSTLISKVRVRHRLCVQDTPLTKIDRILAPRAISCFILERRRSHSDRHAGYGTTSEGQVRVGTFYHSLVAPTPRAQQLSPDACANS